MYIDSKAELNSVGRIGRVTFSKTGSPRRRRNLQG
jgi:hypothetical protein